MNEEGLVGASQLSRYCKFFVFFCSVTWNRTLSCSIFTGQLWYVDLLTLLFYFEGRWACLISILAPAGRLVLAFATGLLGAATPQLLRLDGGKGLRIWCASGPALRCCSALR